MKTILHVLAWISLVASIIFSSLFGVLALALWQRTGEICPAANDCSDAQTAMGLSTGLFLALSAVTLMPLWLLKRRHTNRLSRAAKGQTRRNRSTKDAADGQRNRPPQ